MLPRSSSAISSRAPARVTIHPSVLAQILDHHARRPTTESDSSRVIGTLLGVRHADTSVSATAGGVAELEIRSCFALPHSETESQVAVDMDYHKSMTELMGRVAGSGAHKEVIVGW
jgi:translation initiation factor 3 subunit F